VSDPTLAQSDRAASRGQPSAEPRMPHLALPPGCRVVALEGGRWDGTPCPHPVQPRLCWWRLSRRSARPARARLVWGFQCVCWCSKAGSPGQGVMVGAIGELRDGGLRRSRTWERCLQARRTVGSVCCRGFSRTPSGRGICGSRWARNTHGLPVCHVVAVAAAF
jgi:hypothetical protein